MSYTITEAIKCVKAVDSDPFCTEAVVEELESLLPGEPSDITNEHAMDQLQEWAQATLEMWLEQRDNWHDNPKAGDDIENVKPHVVIEPIEIDGVFGLVFKRKQP